MTFGRLSLGHLTLGVIAGAGGGFIPDIWVDSVNGDDANDGLTQATALQTMVAATAATNALGAGAKIGVLAGHYRADPFTPTVSFDLRRVGSGKVVLDGASILPNAGWSWTAETTGASLDSDDFSSDTSGEWSRGIQSVDGTLAVVSGDLVHTIGAGDGANPRWTVPITGHTIGAQYRLSAPGISGTATTARLHIRTNPNGGGSQLGVSVDSGNPEMDYVATAETLYLSMFTSGTAGQTFVLPGWDIQNLTQNVYQTTITQDVDGRVGCWEDGDVMKWVETIAEVEAEAGTFTLSDQANEAGEYGTEAGPRTVYAHAADSSDITTNGKVYEASTHACIQSSADDCQVHNIVAKRSVARNGNIILGKNVLIKGCILAESVVHEALCESGEYSDTINYHPSDDARSGHIGLEFFVSDGSLLACKHVRCQFLGKEDASQNLTAFGGHNSGNPGEYYAAWDVIDCVSQFGDVSPRADTLTIERLRLKNAVLKPTKTVAGNLSINDVWSEGQPITAISPNISGAGGLVTVDGLRLYGSCETALVSAANLHLKNSVAVDDGSAFRVRGPWNTSGTLKITQCAIASSTRNHQRLAAAAVNTESDNNCFFGVPSFGNYEVDGVVYSTLAALQSAESIELNTIEADPQIADAPNGDFTAQNAAAAALGVGLLRPSTQFGELLVESEVIAAIAPD